MAKCSKCARNPSPWVIVRGICGSCRRDDERAAEREEHVRWFNQTGHCGACGQPGVFCLCTDRSPCGCRDLHEMGSGNVEGALDQFAVITDPDGLIYVNDDQPELFG